MRRSPRPARLVFAAVAGLAWVAGPATAAAQDPEPRQSELPATYLEADERDNGTNDASAWMAGSGIAAIVLVGVGGTVLARRQRRSEADGPSPVA